MAEPQLPLPPSGARGPPAPRLLQAFVLPKTTSSPGSANLCPLPGQEQPFPTAWAPLLAVAPHAPQAPPAGLQRAPCGCYFDPRVFHVEWTSTTLPPPPTTALAHSAASLLGAALWGAGVCGTLPPPAWAAPRTPQGQRQHFTASNHQGRAVAPAPPLLPPSSPGYEHIQDQFARINISSGDTPAGAPLGSNIAPGTHWPTRPSPAPQNQPLGDTAADLTLPEEVPLHEALRLFGCSLDEPGISQEGASSSPTPGNPSATSTGIPPCDFTALSLPKELLSPNYSVPESAEAVLSLEGFSTVGLELLELWGDVGMELPGPQPAMSGLRGKKRGKSPLPKAPRKRRALAGSRGWQAGIRGRGGGY
ncbi:proline-rich protein 22 [Phalacrocorax aristotelis]|uniref:proline-rich protein 22 n=1 Tax=Phalacrocorax aristotelis TaxID=126867 RepID=UPI003F4C0E82